MSSKKYTAPYIDKVLKRAMYCSFSTFNDAKINSRVMVFASSPDLKNFYCVTNKVTDKVRELSGNPYANLLILSTSSFLDDFSETQVHGKAEILSDIRNKSVKEGLSLLSEKSSMINVLHETGSLGDYGLIRIKTEELVFRVYKDILQNIPKTTIKF